MFDNMKRIVSMAMVKNNQPSPKTIVATDKHMKSFFANPQRDLARYENIYRQGGLVSQAIDSYALFILANGYTIEGDNAGEIELWAQDINIDQLIWQSVIDTLVYGDCIQEIVYNKIDTPLYLVPRNPSYFTINFDKYGIIQSYTQRVDENNIILKPEQVLHFSLHPLSGENYGLSLLARAYDDIMRDTKTAESISTAIQRHGFPRYHIKAGSIQFDTEYSDDDKRVIAREFEELKSDNEFVTNPDIEIVSIDTQGIEHVESYNEWSLSRLLGALGVPSEVIGTGQSTTTYATASVEMVSFYNKIKAMQKVVERNYNQLFDLKSGQPGKIKLKFKPLDMNGLANNGKSDL